MKVLKKTLKLIVAVLPLWLSARCIWLVGGIMNDKVRRITKSDSYISLVDDTTIVEYGDLLSDVIKVMDQRAMTGWKWYFK